MMNQEIENYFVCIGAQKAGTTWLSRVLSRHPDLFLTPVKEIHYFDHVRGVTQHLSGRKKRSRYRKYFQRLLTQWSRFAALRSEWSWYRDYMQNPIDDEWYCSLFRRRGQARFAGEATPEYAIIGQEGLEHIKRLAPEARVIFILRHPIERAWSQVLHYVRSNRSDLTQMDDAALKALCGSKSFVALGDYARVFEDLDAVFPASQVLIEFYEDIHADRLAGLERICGFIGTDFDPACFPDLAVRYNRSQNAQIPASLREHLRATYRPLAETIGMRLGRLPESWRADFDV